MNVNPPDRPAPLNWLTFLRYPATIWVIMKHCLHNFGDINAVPDGVRKDFMERGFLGVPFFFILSGFILTYNYPVIRSKRDYLAARAGRILPLYYLALLLSVPMVFHTLAETNLPYVLPRTVAFLTLTQAWIPDWTSFWNFPGWTLSCEVFFYSFLILLLPWIQSIASNSPVRMILIIAGCFVFGLIGPTWFHFTYGDPKMRELENPANAAMIQASTFIKIFPIWHLAEFTSGVALCVGMRSRLASLRPFSGWLIIAGVLEVLTSPFIPAIFSQGTWCLPGFVLIILGAAALPYPDIKTSRLGSIGLLLGNVSYSVYLFHIPVIFYLGFINRHVHPIFPTAEAGVWSLFFSDVAITTLIGIPLYSMCEQPARKWMVQRLKKQWGGSENEAIALPMQRGPV